MLGAPPSPPPRSRVTLHFAQSLDGRIAARSGSAKWISGPSATRFAHELRAAAGAVVVGSGTALTDDPLLTVRLVEGAQPLRIVLDGRARLPATLRVFRDPSAPTLHVTCTEADARPAPHVERWTLPRGPAGEGVDLGALVTHLHLRGVPEVLVEGGQRILTAFLRAGLVDRMIVTVAPMILGAGIDAVGDLGATEIAHALRFRAEKVYRLGDDVMIELVPRSPGEAGAQQ